MQFNLQDSVDYILNTDHSPQLRAIELFTFLVVLHGGASRKMIAGNRRTNENGSSLILDVPRKLVSAARILPAIKFLDRIEQDWRLKTGSNSLPVFRKMIEIPEYEEIANDIIVANGSWYKLRFLDSVRDLESELEDWKRQARSVARIIEFSFRFEPNPKKPRQLGGVTMAIDIVTSVPYFRVKVKDSQLEKAWSRLQSGAPFLYLIYVQKYPFYLREIAGSSFAERFLAMASDQARLLEFFAQYNVLIGELRNRGYKYDPLQLPKTVKSDPLSREPFRSTNKGECAVLDEIDCYRTG
jgi:hypothetical protein